MLFSMDAIFSPGSRISHYMNVEEGRSFIIYYYAPYSSFGPAAEASGTGFCASVSLPLQSFRTVVHHQERIRVKETRTRGVIVSNDKFCDG
jgi:hypothetical protein